MVTTSPTDMFDRITALSLDQITNAINDLVREHRELGYLTIENKAGRLDALIDPLQLVQAESIASTSIRLLVPLRIMEFVPENSKTSVNPYEQTLIWNINLSPYNMNNPKIPHDILTKLNKPSDYSPSYLFFLFTLVDLGQFDELAAGVLVPILKEYILDLKKGSRHLLGFKPTDDSKKVASTDPLTDTRFLILPSPEKMPDHDVFLFLEGSKSGSLPPGAEWDNLSTWVPKLPDRLSYRWLDDGHGINNGTMIIDGSKIFGQYIQDRTGFVFGEVLAMLNACYYTTLNNGQDVPEHCEWVLLERPLGDNWNAWDPLGRNTGSWHPWNSTPFKGQYTISWSPNEGDYNRSYHDDQFDGTLNVVHDSNKIVCSIETLVSARRDGCWRTVGFKVEVTITMKGVSPDGKIEFEVQSSGIKSEGQIFKSIGFFEMLSLGPVHEHLDDSNTQNLNNRLKVLVAKQVEVLVDRWRLALNVDHPFVLPGRDYFKTMENPVFNAYKDLIVEVEYRLI